MRPVAAGRKMAAHRPRPLVGDPQWGVAGGQELVARSRRPAVGRRSQAACSRRSVIGGQHGAASSKWRQSSTGSSRRPVVGGQVAGCSRRSVVGSQHVAAGRMRPEVRREWYVASSTWPVLCGQFLGPPTRRPAKFVCVHLVAYHWQPIVLRRVLVACYRQCTIGRPVLAAGDLPPTTGRLQDAGRRLLTAYCLPDVGRRPLAVYSWSATAGRPALAADDSLPATGGLLLVADYRPRTPDRVVVAAY